MVVRELGPAIGNGVLINAVNPGFCLSELMRHAVFPLNFLGWIGKKLIARVRFIIPKDSPKGEADSLKKRLVAA